MNLKFSWDSIWGMPTIDLRELMKSQTKTVKTK